MADNVTSDPGSGGVTWQTASFAWSGDTIHSAGGFQGLLAGSEGSWTYTLLVGGAGAVGAGVQRMTLASDDPAVALLTSIDADTGACAVSLAIVDDWDESDRCKVNLVAGQAGITAGAGAVGANTPRVTLASDDPAVAVLGTIDADTGSIATSASTIATNTDNAATSLAVVDDWDESDRCKTNPIVGQAGVAAGAGSVGATVQRMTLASDDPAVALLGTMDADTGNIATNTSGAATSLAIVDDWDESDRCKVNPIAGQAGVAGGSGTVDATTQRVCLATNVALPAGTNTLGNVGMAPQTAGGLTAHKTISAASTNATNVKASAGQLFGWYISNTNAAARYLKFYNNAGSPTVGTDTPVMTLLIPGNTAGVAGHNEMANGIAFSTGIAFALTTGVADSNTDAVAANELVVNLFYK